MLTENDKKYWRPSEDILNYVASLVADGARVLEVGPGDIPFSKATDFVDHDPQDERYVVCDIQDEPLPYADKSFDFVYCRHVVEDLTHPFLVLREMSRVGKAGYIETPSPLAETARGVDGGSPPWRGYHNHNWFVWSYDGILNFMRKAPMLEYIPFNEDAIETTLKNNPLGWNTYFLWSDEIKYINHHYTNKTVSQKLSEAILNGNAGCQRFIDMVMSATASQP